MHPRVLSMFLALGVLLGMEAPSRADLVLANAGFESGGLAPWFQSRDFSSGADWSVTAQEPHSGVFCAAVVGNKELRQNFPAIPTDEVEEVSFWLRHPAGARIAFVDLFYADSTDTGFVVSTQSADWEFFDVTAELVPGEQLTGLSIFGYLEFGTAADQTFLDDVTVRTANVLPVPEPSGLRLVAAGILVAAVPVCRRRNGSASSSRRRPCADLPQT